MMATLVTGIHFGSGHEEELPRIPAFFLVLEVAYLLLRYSRSRSLHDA